MGVEVRTYAGVPPLSAFGATGGTPIVINTLTSIAYYVAPGEVVTPLGGGGGGGVTVQETDGSPSGAATTLIFPDGYVLSVAANIATIVGDPGMIHSLYGGI